MRLFLFGSGASDGFDEQRSDLDFLVEFAPAAPAVHAEHYLGLLQDLEQLFRRHIDLVEAGPIRNPFFREEVERTKLPLYAAA